MPFQHQRQLGAAKDHRIDAVARLHALDDRGQAVARRVENLTARQLAQVLVVDGDPDRVVRQDDLDFRMGENVLMEMTAWRGHGGALYAVALVGGGVHLTAASGWTANDSYGMP